MKTFIGLYRGTKVDEAQLIAVCSDASLVIVVATQILGQMSDHALDDPVLDVLRQHRIDALRLLLDDVTDQSGTDLLLRARGGS